MSSQDRVVQIDGQVVLRMIKHQRDTGGDCGGMLLGLPRDDGLLEVTACIPSKQGNANPDETEDHTESMLECMRKVNFDANNAGFFVVSSIDAFFAPLNLDNKHGKTSGYIEEMFVQQTEFPYAVCLLMEPYRRGSGQLNIKAFRLTDQYMKLHADAPRVDDELDTKDLVQLSNSFSQTAFNRFGIGAEDIFESVPVQVHNSNLVHAFLYDLRESKAFSADPVRLGIHVNGFAEQQLESMGGAVEQYETMLGQLHYTERLSKRNKDAQAQWLAKRKSENELRAKQGLAPLPDDRSKVACFKPQAKPSRLDTYLITNRLSHMSNALLSDTMQGFSKMYVVDALHR